MYVFVNYDFNSLTHTYPTHLRIDSLLFGVLLSYLYTFTKIEHLCFVKESKILLIISFLFLHHLFLLIKYLFMHVFGFTLLYVGFGILVMQFVLDNGILQKVKRIISKKAVLLIVKIGFYSYSIYLFHMFFAVFLLKYLPILNIQIDYRVSFIFFLILSVSFGISASKIIESPVLKIRNKYFK